jgi:peptidoglycan/LPS O-acetylase OafA/YrhL
MAAFSLVNGGQRWFDERGLGLGPYGAFAWDVLPLAAFVVAASKAVGRGEPASVPAPRLPVAHDPLLVLRAFACCMVLGGHGVGFAFRSPDFIADIAAGVPAWLVAPSPQCGVWIFFVLSGYLIGKGFNTGRYDGTRASVARFMTNRCLRILPTFWLMTGSILVIAHTAILAPHSLLLFFNIMAFNVDGRFAFIPIGALWSIATEMQFYLVAPMLCIVLRLRGAGLVACIALAAATVAVQCAARMMIIAAFGTVGWYDAYYMPLVGNIDLFLLGMVASRSVIIGKARGWRLRRGLGAGWGVMLALYVAMSWLYVHALNLKEPVPAYLFAAFATSVAGLASAAAIVCFELAPRVGPQSWLYRWGRPFETFGLLTYAIYSLHEPVFLVFKYHLPAPPNLFASVALCVVVCAFLLIPALAMYRFIEQPFLRMKWHPDRPDAP